MASRDNARTVSTEGRRNHPSFVTNQGDNLNSGLRIPNLGLVVMASGDNARAVSTERHRIYRIPMALY